MMWEVTPKEHKEAEKRLIKFCKDNPINHCLMYNYMHTIEGIRKERDEKYCLDKSKVEKAIRFCHKKNLGMMRLVKELKL